MSCGYDLALQLFIKYESQKWYSMKLISCHSKIFSVQTKATHNPLDPRNRKTRMSAFVHIPRNRFSDLTVCMSSAPPKTVLYLIVVGGEQPSRGMPGGAMPSEVKAIG